MRVVMTVSLSGMRNGADWPPRGTPIDLPDAEAKGYIQAGMAREVSDDEPEVETRPAPAADVETRPALTKRTGPVKKNP